MSAKEAKARVKAYNSCYAVWEVDLLFPFQWLFHRIEDHCV